MSDLHARLKRAAQLSADAGGDPDTMLVPKDIVDQFDCNDVLHVYPGVTSDTRCKCGRHVLGAKGYDDE